MLSDPKEHAEVIFWCIYAVSVMKDKHSLHLLNKYSEDERILSISSTKVAVKEEAKWGLKYIQGLTDDDPAWLNTFEQAEI